MEDKFLADETYDTEFGIRILKNRELEESTKGKLKTTFRCIDLELVGKTDKLRLREVLKNLFKHFKKSIRKAYNDNLSDDLVYSDFEDALMNGIRVPVVLEIKSEMVFDNSYTSVVKFFEKVATKTKLEELV